MKNINNDFDIEVFEFINSQPKETLNYSNLKEFLIKNKMALKDIYLYYLWGRMSYINRESNAFSLTLFRANLELNEWKSVQINFELQLKEFMDKFDKTTLIFINEKIGEELFILHLWRDITKLADSAIMKLEEADDLFEFYYY